MADTTEISKVIIDECTCGVCQEEFNEKTRVPKLLHCSHTLCKACVSALLGGGRGMYREMNSILYGRANDHDSFKCPFCNARQVTEQGNVDNLPNNLTILRLLDFTEGNQAAKELKKMVEKCKDRIERLHDMTELKFEREMGSKIRTLNEHFDDIAKHLEEKRAVAIRQVEAAFEIKKSSTTALTILRKARNSIRSADDVLKRNDAKEIIDSRSKLVTELRENCLEGRLEEGKLLMVEETHHIEFVASQDIYKQKLGEVEVKYLLQNKPRLLGRTSLCKDVFFVIFVSLGLLSLNLIESEMSPKQKLRALQDVFLDTVTKNSRVIQLQNYLPMISKETHQELADRTGLHVVELREEYGRRPIVVASPSDKASREALRKRIHLDDYDLDKIFDPHKGLHRPKKRSELF
ncbi:predicted protein [Nematostella vectensis]|uniref:RING-type domain-containing protein n=1 Tax=Nematostella vectensis TaxID=45351 RepID=A7RP04_NEMVE|nr:predicted protein [Nematostella vectensis]|eukprot:XP_001638833.1 predicted protein [Nematostella vectensis]